jgi:hypothetical protein
MTTHARLVLSDARDAVDDLVDGIVGSEWRRRWTAAVVLLRTTMYVLKDVDAERDVQLGRVVAEMWDELNKRKPDPPIFWDFIDKDRQLLAHMYEHRAGQNVTVHGVGVGTIPYSEITYEVFAGSFARREPRHLAREALDWLQWYLDETDRRAAAVDHDA